MKTNHEASREGLEEELAIYLAAVIIPAGPHAEVRDPSLAWARPYAQHPNEVAISEGEPTGPGSPGDCLSEPLWSWSCLGAPKEPALSRSKESARAGSGQVLLEWSSPL